MKLSAIFLFGAVVMFFGPSHACSISPDYKGSANPCKMPYNPNLPEYHETQARAQTETRRYVPERFKKSDQTVIMVPAATGRSIAAETGGRKSEARLADAPGKPILWKGSR